MASLKELIVKIGADTKGLDAGINSASGKLSAFGDKATAVGGTLTTSLTAPIVAAGAGILLAAGNFEQGMNKVAAISGATGAEFEALESQAKTLGATTKFSATQAAEGMAFLSMAGFDASETISAMPGLLSLAAASGMDLGTAADIASNVLSGFGLAAAEAGRTADVLAKAAASSNTNVAQLGEAMKYIAPVAASVGMSMEEAAAFIGKLGDAGIQASMAGTNLRGMIAGLIDPSKEASSRLAALGVSTKDTSGNMLPLRDILGQLKNAGMEASDAFAIFGRLNASAALTLKDSLPSYDELVGKLESSNGAADKMAETMQKGLNGAFTSLMSATEGLAIAIADSGLLDWATSLVVAFTDIVREIGTASPELLKIGTIIAGVAAAAGPVLVVLGSVASGFAAIAPTVGAASAAFAAVATGPIGLSVAALAAISVAVLAIGTDTDTVVGDWKQSWANIKTTATQVGAAVVTEIKAAWNGLVTFSGPVFQKLSDIATSAMGIVVELLKMPGIKESLTVIWESIKAIIGGAWTAISGIISGALDVIAGTLNVALGLLRGDWQAAGDGLVQIAQGFWTAITGVFTGGYNAVVGTVVGLKNAILGQFSDLGNELVGNSIVPDEIVDPTIGEFERMGAGGKAAVGQLSTDVTGAFSSMGTTLSTSQTAFGTWATGVKDTVSGLDLGGKLFSGGSTIDNIKTTLGSFGQAFKDKLMQPAKDAINDLVDKGISALMGALDGLIAKLTGSGGLQSAFNAAFGTAGGAGGGIGGAVGGGGGGGAGGSGGGAAGGGSGALGAIGAVTGVVTAASSVWGNFQNMEIETGIDAIEKETRETKLWIESNVVPALWSINEAVSWGAGVKAIEALSAFTQGPLFQTMAGIFDQVAWGYNVKANERSAEELSGIRGEIAALAAKLEQLVNRDIVITIDGQEIARAVGAGQEQLRSTA